MANPSQPLADDWERDLLPARDLGKNETGDDDRMLHSQ